MKSQHLGLTRDFRVNPLSCSNPSHYEEYLKFYAITDKRVGLGVTHLFLDINDGITKIAGFITLKATSLMKIYDEYTEGRGALEITEIAIDQSYEKRGFGTLLVQFAVAKAQELKQNHLGIEYIVLCADPEVVGFYSRQDLGFVELQEYYDIPREGWNVDCTPMLIRLPE